MRNSLSATRTADRTCRAAVLAVRPDGMGDVLLTGPAVRAMAASGAEVVFLAGPAGASAAALLPGVHRVVQCRVPWIEPDPPEFQPATVHRLIVSLHGLGIGEAVIFTSFHQSPLPTALALRMAGVRRVSAISEDYPGSLLDVRHQVTADIPEADRNLSLVRAAGFALPPGDRGGLAIRGALPDASHLTGGGRYIVVHPGASVPARRPSAATTAAIAAELAAAGHRVMVTGAAAERRLAGQVCDTARTALGARGLPPSTAPVDLSGRTSLPLLAAVLAGAEVAVVPNTGAAHLAAAVGTPVVSLFAPVVPAARWAPYGVPTVLLGDQQASCAGTRARSCPVAGHPCLDTIDPGQVADAVAALCSARPRPSANPLPPARPLPPTGRPPLAPELSPGVPA